MNKFLKLFFETVIKNIYQIFLRFFLIKFAWVSFFNFLFFFKHYYVGLVTVKSGVSSPRNSLESPSRASTSFISWVEFHPKLNYLWCKKKNFELWSGGGGLVSTFNPYPYAFMLFFLKCGFGLKTYDGKEGTKKKKNSNLPF